MKSPQNVWRCFPWHEFIQEAWPNRPSTLDDVENLIFSIIFQRMGRCIRRPSSCPLCPALRPEAAARVIPETTAQRPLQGLLAAPTALGIHLFILEEGKRKRKKNLENQGYSHQLPALQAAQGILVCLHPHLDPSGFKWTVKHVAQREAGAKLKTSSLTEANKK